MSAESRIRAAAAKNSALLQTLSETDYASSALKQNESYIASIKSQIESASAEEKKLARSVKKEQAEHERYQHSTMKRFAYKVSGKKDVFNERAAKEEREYFEAVQAHFQATRTLEGLQKNLDEAERTRKDLEEALERNRKAQLDLDRLYDSIFDGPTPEFPEEDQLEQPVRAAIAEFNSAQAELTQRTQAHGLLLTAQHYLEQCLSALDSAQRNATMDVWGVGGSYADMAKHSALAQAQVNAGQAQMGVIQAQATAPPGEIKSLPDLRIAAPSMMGDVLFDNVFSDMRAKRMIEESFAQARVVARHMSEIVRDSGERVGAGQSQVKELKRDLGEKRKQLQDARTRVFQVIAAGRADSLPAQQEASEQPPSYTA